MSRRSRHSAPAKTGPDRTLLLAAAAVLLSVLVYAPTLRFGFVYDDQPQILQNPTVQARSFQTVFFTAHVWEHQNPEWKGNYYRPLFLLWLQANYLLFGRDPFSWHATSVAVHALATLLVFLVARRLLKSGALAAFAAMLFAVDPVHTETVAWISGVDESLGAVFFLASFLFWLKWRDKAGKPMAWLAGSLACFAAAVLFKENVVVLPAVILVYEWLLGDGLRTSLRCSLPFWLVAVGYFALRLHVLAGLANPGSEATLGTLWLSAPLVLWFYIFRLFWPFGVTLFYMLHHQTVPTLGGFVVPLLQVIAVAGIAVVLSRGSRIIGFLCSGILFLLAPFLVGMYVFRDYELVHDRYLYVASALFVILIAHGLGYARDRLPAHYRRGLVVAIVSVIVVAWSVESLFAARPWNDNVSLFQHAIEGAPRSPLPWLCLAEDLVHRGQPAQALPLYEEAYKLDPQSWKITLALASTHLLLEHYQQAESLFLRTIEIYPSHETPLGLAYYLLGVTQNRLGKHVQAELNLRKAIAIHPRFSQYHYELALALQGQGKGGEARQAVETELSIFPASQEAQRLRAQLGP